MNKTHYWDADDTTQNDIEEMIETAQPFYFQFQGSYLVEWYDIGFIIVDPFRYYAEGGYPEITQAAYRQHLQAKTPQEFKSLAFLDGKTLFERWSEVRFFNI